MTDHTPSMPITHYTNGELQDQIADAEMQIRRLEGERDDLSAEVTSLTEQLRESREETERLSGLLSEISDITRRA